MKRTGITLIVLSLLALFALPALARLGGSLEHNVSSLAGSGDKEASIAGYTGAQPSNPSAEQPEHPASGQPTKPLDSLLNENGTLNLQSGFSGSLDPTGWVMETGAGGQPRFERTGEKEGQARQGKQPGRPQPKEKSPFTPFAPLALGDENWDSRFRPPGVGGAVGSPVNALAISGIDVYVGGRFTTAGEIPANRIARWDGSNWSALGSGVNGAVLAVVISGTNVYVGGQFTTAGGVPANRIARWDGSSWSALGSGVGSTVNAIAISGTDVYVGGLFTTAGGVPASRIARWDGSSWSALGSGVGSTVNAIAISGTDVYVGGSFTTVGGVPASRIARWDGSSWSALGSGVGSSTDSVIAIAINGTDVYVGGGFTIAGGISANNMARWDGSNWSSLGSGVSYIVRAITTSGTNVYVGGFFTTAGGMPASRVARWNGSSWSALGSGVDNDAWAIASRGTDVYAGGNFTTAGGTPANNVARWNGSSWSAMDSSSSVGGVNDTMRAIAISGTDVYVGGDFTMAGGVPASRIARWDGSAWSALGTGMNNNVNAIAISGTDVYVGGDFTMAGGVQANFIAMWDGSNWSALGSGVGSVVRAIAISGTDVYVGGDFASAGGVLANYIAMWDGSSWSALGSGVDNAVWAITTRGTDVYVGGDFTTAGGLPASRVARWNGSSWSALGSGVDDIVWAMTTSGTDVYAGGDFTTAGGAPASRIARWNGSSWSALDDGVNDIVGAIAISGTDVYVGGGFTTAGGISASRIARWDSSNWSALGSGVNSGSVTGLVDAIAISGNNVYVGGFFTAVGGLPASYFGLWHVPTPPTPTSTPTPCPTCTNTPTATLTLTPTTADTATLTDTTTPTPACGLAWRTVANPDIGSGQDIQGVAAISANDIWAVGYYFFGSGYQTLTEHWDGNTWNFVPSPSVGAYNSQLQGVTALSANDVWAVGSYINSDDGRDYTLIEHWDGSNWIIVPSPSPGQVSNSLAGIAAISADDVWAVGYYNDGDFILHTLIEHWDGNNWSVVPSPSPGQSANLLSGIEAISANDVWAVGYYRNSDYYTLIEHWDGNSWSVVPSPGSSSSQTELLDITAVSATDVWAVGYYAVGNPFFYNQLIEHWNGSNWIIFPAPSIGPSDSILTGVSAVATNDVWAVGVYCIMAGCSPYQTVTEHWDGSNWSRASSPNPGSSGNYLKRVAVASATDVWAVGFSGSRGLMLRYSEPCITPTPTEIPTNTQTPTSTPTNTTTPTPTTCVVANYSISQSTGASIVPGTTDVGNHGDDDLTIIALPFPVQLYDRTFSSARVGSNGNLLFSTSGFKFDNVCLPFVSFGNSIMPYWDDLRTDITGTVPSGIFTSVSGNAPNRIFNIEWRACLFAGASCGGDVNFEARLYEDQNRIDMVYGTVVAGGSGATVGVQKSAAILKQFSCPNFPLPLSPGLQLTFTTNSCPTNTPTSTPTATITNTPTNTEVVTPGAPTNTPTDSPTITLTPTGTATPTATSTPETTTTTYTSTETPAIIPDGETITSTIETTAGFARSGGLSPRAAPLSTFVIYSVEVTGINLTYTQPSELSMELISPSGTGVRLFSGPCPGDSWTTSNTGFTLSDGAVTQIGSVCPPGQAAYRPQGPLTSFIGETASGVWTLRITDHVPGGGVGTFNGWGLRITTQCVDCPTATPTSTPTATPVLVLVGHVMWQGRPAQPNGLQQLPITLTLKSAVGETNYPVQTTDASGFFTNSIGGLPNGLYLARVKGAKYLANVVSVALTGVSVTNMDLGQMKAGDCNDDNRVNSVDFTLLKNTFGKAMGDPGYDDRADFTGDGRVNASDFTLLKNNFGFVGGPPIGPGRP